jgi:hypothetical protein
VKPARAELGLVTATDGVVVVRRPADPARRAKLIRLLSVLMDKPATPEEDGTP